MAEMNDDAAQIANVPVITPEEQEKQLACETYLWLDERLSDRDEKDALTLELATHLAVG